MVEEGPHLRCKHLIHHSEERGRAAPSNVCSCPAGLIHMYDCPVSLGLECVHFGERTDEVAAFPEREFEELHARLMEDYLTRSYYHRVRSLAPEGDSWHAWRDELARAYAEDVEAEAGEAAARDDESYEREKERLIEQRRRRDAEREQRRTASKDAAAAERARHGIKTVVEKAQETVADRGNVATSYLDDIELPKKSRSGRGGGRRRGSGGGGPSGGDTTPKPKPAAEGASERPRPRRRRRRRRGGGGGKASSS
jgi:hypothetical protein